MTALYICYLWLCYELAFLCLTFGGKFEMCVALAQLWYMVLQLDNCVAIVVVAFISKLY